MTEIRLEEVEKSFGSGPVINKLDLTIKRKEFFTFVGESGCGKSTILNMIAGLEDLSKGKIFFNDKPVNSLSPAERDVAMVFQSYALYPHMTVYENIAFPLKIKKEKKDVIDREVKRAVKSLGLEGLLNRKPSELSGGQRQRVALGRAIVRKPSVFLMDEPLSNLDARLRIDMRTELKKIHNGLMITTIYVTHDQEEAMSLSDRIAVLHNGQILQCDTPMEIYERPANLFVAGFIGSPPMNFIDSSLLKEYNFFDIQKYSSNEDILIGLRPEDISVSTESKGHFLEADVAMLEPVGGYQWVDGLFRGVKIKGKADIGKDILLAKKAFFNFNPKKLHFFYCNTEKRI